MLSTIFFNAGLFLRNLATIPSESLALFRFTLGLNLVWFSLSRVPFTTELMTQEGLLPVSMVNAPSANYFGNLILPWGNSGTGWTLLFIGACSGVFVMLGRFVRSSLLFGWFSAASIYHRFPDSCNGGDLLLVVLLLYSVLLFHFHSLAKNQFEDFCHPACAAILLQIVTVYIFAAVAKSDPSWRISGDALPRALSLDSLTTTFGVALRSAPHGLLCLLGRCTLLLEEIVPLLTLFASHSSRLRTLGAFVMISFHLSISACFDLGQFPFVSMSAWILFIPSRFYKLFRRSSHKSDGCLRIGVGDFLPLGLAFLALIKLSIFTFSHRSTMPGVKMALAGSMQFLGFDQGWSFFAPSVRTAEGTLRVYIKWNPRPDASVWPTILTHDEVVIPAHLGSRFFREYCAELIHFKNPAKLNSFATWISKKHKVEPSMIEIWATIHDNSDPQKEEQKLLLYPIQGH